MKIKLLTAGAFLAALAMPLSVCAQQSQYPYPSSQAPSQAGTTPSGERIHQRWMRRLGNLNLSGDQQQHIRSLIDQYSQSHPEGTPRDPGASRELRRQILGVLTGDPAEPVSSGDARRVRRCNACNNRIKTSSIRDSPMRGNRLLRVSLRIRRRPPNSREAPRASRLLDDHRRRVLSGR